MWLLPAHFPSARDTHTAASDWEVPNYPVPRWIRLWGPCLHSVHPYRWGTRVHYIDTLRSFCLGSLPLSRPSKSGGAGSGVPGLGSVLNGRVTSRRPMLWCRCGLSFRPGFTFSNSPRSDPTGLEAGRLLSSHISSWAATCGSLRVQRLGSRGIQCSERCFYELQFSPSGHV